MNQVPKPSLLKLLGNYRLPLSMISTIALYSVMPMNLPTFAQSSGSIAQLSAQQQSALRSGRVVLEGENGQYTGRVLVTASVDTAWNVLTDYNNFKNFIPTVISSAILKADGTKKTYEQVNVTRILVFSYQSRLVVATSESYPTQIAFRAIEGDVNSLVGAWMLEPVSPNQVLVTHQVAVEPNASVPRRVFFNIYKSTLENSIGALKQEMERRSAKK